MAGYPDRNAAGTRRRFGRQAPNTQPVTFANLIANEYFLFPRCMACGTNGRPIDPRPLAARYGIDKTVGPLDRLFKCDQCGEKGKVQTHVNLPPGYPHTNKAVRAYEWWDAQPARDAIERMKQRRP